jgi:hypothetical protein
MADGPEVDDEGTAERGDVVSGAYAGRLFVHDREMQLDVYGPLAVGDSVDVIRGNGPREGEHMGSAIVTAIKNGEPVLEVRFDGIVKRLDDELDE